MPYVNRLGDPPLRSRAVQVQLRLPADLIVEMDRICEEYYVRRSALIVAALRTYLKFPPPAERIMAAAGEEQ
jgi:metal-responsive CopG/Arc/MetJ family transcriptional regulator